MKDVIKKMKTSSFQTKIIMTAKSVLEHFLKTCKDQYDFHSVPIADLYKHFEPWFESYRRGEPDYIPNLKGMTQYDLCEEEVIYILGYTGFNSSWIKYELKNGQKIHNTCKQLYIDNLTKVLDKIPSYNSQTVFRMDDGNIDAENDLNWFDTKKAQSFCVPYFLSTAKEDYKNSTLVWQIETLEIKSGARDISNLSNNKFEMEVLFQRDSKFEIIDVNKEKKYVHLKEIDRNVISNFDLIGVYTQNF